jgi:hypothetical protein
MHNDITTLIAPSYVGYISRAIHGVSVFLELPTACQQSEVYVVWSSRKDKKVKTEKKASLIPNDGNIDK